MHCRPSFSLFAALLLSPVLVWADAGSTRLCAGSGVEVQVLGSGGPIPDDARASSGYLVWIDGRARVLVDAGGGIFLRFGAAGADLMDLQHIAITHLHADHSADLAALVKAGYFSARTDPLSISGPDGRGPFPPLSEFLERQFSTTRGSYAYLAGALDGSGGQFQLRPQDVDHDAREPIVVFSDKDLTVSAIGVNHGPVPALGYLITAQNHTVAFSGDQSADNPAFWKLINKADLLLMHHAVPQGADRIASNLHAEPRSIGQHAADAEIATLVLSHLMPRSLASLKDSLQLITGMFHGELLVANDMDCFKPSSAEVAAQSVPLISANSN